MKPEDRAILAFLARTMDIASVMERYPELGKEGLRKILAEAASDPSSAHAGKIEVFIDGASRGNPGESGAGVVFKDTAGKVVQKISLYLGRATNNMAEYKALILALGRAREMGVDSLQVYSDSELLVRQVNGRYRVRAPHLQELCQEAIRLMRDIGQVNISHITRDKNTEADEQANHAIDQSLKG